MKKFNLRVNPQIASVILAVIVTIPLLWIFLNPEIFKKVLVVVKVNYSFWVIALISVGFGLYRKIKNPREFLWIELPVQILVSVLVVFISFSLLFYSSSDLSDTEIHNNFIVSADHYQAWTEYYFEDVCDYRDDDGNCISYHTEKRYRRHKPRWEILLSSGKTISISSHTYSQIVNKFGNQKFKKLNRTRQSSIGDGNKYYSKYDGDIRHLIPVAQEHKYVNYVKASYVMSKQSSAAMSDFSKYLLDYPRVYDGPYGHFEINRVLDANTNFPSEWKQHVDLRLDQALSRLGFKKQVNILVYLVGSSSKQFVNALDAHWKGGKKNDVIVLVGSKNFPQVDWVDVMAWTDVKNFKTGLKNTLFETNIEDPEKFVQTIVNFVEKPSVQGGYKRKPMSDYEYLASSIQLSWWIQLIIVIVSLVISWVCSEILINNSFYEGNKRRRLHRRMRR